MSGREKGRSLNRNKLSTLSTYMRKMSSSSRPSKNGTSTSTMFMVSDFKSSLPDGSAIRIVSMLGKQLSPKRKMLLVGRGMIGELAKSR